MEELKKDFPQGVDYRIVYDPTMFVRESIDAVVETLVEALLLVVLVVLLFLRTWRASIIPLAAVPVSLVGTLAAMHLLGFSLNALSLFGLVLAIGIVVDDAIVVVENVERNIAKGLTSDRRREAGDARGHEPDHRDLGRADRRVRADGVHHGLERPVLRAVRADDRDQHCDLGDQLADAVAGARSVAAEAARRGAGPVPARHRPRVRLGYPAVQPLLRVVVRALRRAHGQDVEARGCRDVASTSAWSALTWLGFRSVPEGFIPQQDKEYLVAFAQLPEAATLDRTEDVIRRMTDIMLAEPGVAHSVAFPGLSVNGFVNAPNVGIAFVALRDFEDPNFEKTRSANEIAAALNQKFAAIQDAYIAVFPPPPVQGLGTIGGFKLQIEDRAGLGFEALYEETQKIVGAGWQTPGLTGLFSSYQVNVPQVRADVDRDKAMAQGVPLNEIFETMQVYLGSLYVNDFNRFGRTYQVNAQADMPFRLEPEDIRRSRCATRAATWCRSARSSRSSKPRAPIASCTTTAIRPPRSTAARRRVTRRARPRR